MDVTTKGSCGATRRRQGGYTLVEILIVMGLMGIFVTLVMPNFNALIPDMKVDKAASKLAADLRLAQQRAVGDMAYVLVYLNTSQNNYYAVQSQRDKPGFIAVKDALKGSDSLFVDFDNHKTFSGLRLISVADGMGSVDRLMLSPLGSLVWVWQGVSLRAPSGAVTITLQQPSTGYSRQVQISHPLGKVTILP